MSKIKEYLLSQASDDLDMTDLSRMKSDLEQFEQAPTNSSADENYQIYSITDIKEAIKHSVDEIITYDTTTISNKVDMDDFSQKLLDYLTKLKRYERRKEN